MLRSSRLCVVSALLVSLLSSLSLAADQSRSVSAMEPEAVLIALKKLPMRAELPMSQGLFYRPQRAASFELVAGDKVKVVSFRIVEKTLGDLRWVHVRRVRDEAEGWVYAGKEGGASTNFRIQGVKP